MLTDKMESIKVSEMKSESIGASERLQLNTVPLARWLNSTDKVPTTLSLVNIMFFVVDFD